MKQTHKKALLSAALLAAALAGTVLALFPSWEQHKEQERQAALVLNRSLHVGKALVEAGETSAQAVKQAVTQEIEKEPMAKIDYVDVVDFESVTPIEKLDAANGSILVAIAVYIGKTRLIDNFIVER